MENMFNVIKVEENEMGSFNVFIKRESDGKVVMCDDVMLWDEDDKEMLEEMFMMVEEGEW